MNNAMIMRAEPIETFRLAGCMAVIMVNQVGTFLGMKAALSVMRAGGGQAREVYESMKQAGT